MTLLLENGSGKHPEMNRAERPNKPNAPLPETGPSPLTQGGTFTRLRLVNSEIRHADFGPRQGTTTSSRVPPPAVWIREAGTPAAVRASRTTSAPCPATRTVPLPPMAWI